MAKLNVNIGLSVNDKTGDTLRTAFDKINQNFTELYTLTGGTSTALIELAQDYAAPMFNHASHTNITVTYDDANNKILLTGVASAVWPVTNTAGANGPTRIAIGNSAGDIAQGNATVAVGSYAGNDTQGGAAVAIGTYAGTTTQRNDAIAIGYLTGNDVQGIGAVSIGRQAGQTNQGAYSIAIGKLAGQTNQAANTIILNALNAPLNGVSAQTNSFYVNPIRTDATPGNILFYNTTTKEITYGAAGSVSSLVNGANTVSLDNGGLDLTFTSGEKIKTTYGGGIELYRSGDNTIGVYTSGAEIKTFATGGAKHTWTFGTNGSFKLPNNSELRPSTTAYDTALAGWEFIRGGEITDRITNNLATALGWPMVNWYPTGATAQGYIDFLLNAKTLQDTAGATLIIQPAMSTTFYNEMRAALIAIRDSYNTSTTAFSLSSAYGKSWNFGTDGKLTTPGNLQVNGGKIILNTGGNAYVESVDYGVNSGNSAVNIFGGPYQKIKLRAGFGTEAAWTFGTDGALTFPNGTLKITNSVISNLNVVGDLSTGSRIQVGSGVAANTGIIISNSVTNSLGGGPALESGSLVNVNGSSAYMALKTVNSLGGAQALTGEEMVEVSSSGVRIGVRVTNDLGDGSSPLIAFSGWTFDAEQLSLPKGAVINETPSSPGLYRTKYSGTFVLDPTWFVTNAGNLIETTIINDTIIMHDYITGAFSFQYFGYFVPPTSANYTFRAHADETFIFWIGAKALSGYTYANKDMYGDYNGTFPEQQTQSFTIALTAGQFYPIRIQWANSGGFGELDVFTWANDVGQANTANFTGRIYTANTGTAKIAVNDNKSIILSTDNTTDNNWTFAPNGSLTLPIGVSIDSSVGPLYPKIIADSGKLFSVQGQGSTGSAALAWTVDPNAAGQYASVAVTRAGGDNLAKVVLQAQSNSGDAATVKLWKFDETGRTTFPNGVVPEHSYGAAGDKEGMVVFSDPYIYYCKQDYVNNTTDIWVRVAWTGTNW